MKVFSLVLGLLAATAIGLPTNETGSAIATVEPPVITVAPLTNETGPIAINNNGPAINDTGSAKNDTGFIKNETNPAQIIDTAAIVSDGIIHLGDDGVLRSFAPNLTVLAYLQLNNTQIQHMIDLFGRTDHLSEIFKGVSGFDVCEEELSHPKKENLPLWSGAPVAPTSPNPAYSRSIYSRQIGALNSPLLAIYNNPDTDPNVDRCHQIRCRYNEECFDHHPSCAECYFADAYIDGICMP